MTPNTKFIVSILILLDILLLPFLVFSINWNINKVSILILLDILLLQHRPPFDCYRLANSFNPYFTGYTTFTRTFAKTLYLSVLQIFFQTLKLQFLN